MSIYLVIQTVAIFGLVFWLNDYMLEDWVHSEPWQEGSERALRTHWRWEILKKVAEKRGELFTKKSSDSYNRTQIFVAIQLWGVLFCLIFCPLMAFILRKGEGVSQEPSSIRFRW